VGSREVEGPWTSNSPHARGLYRIGKLANQAPPPDHQTTEAEKSKSYINRMSERETVVELPFAAD
jgi:hypothetical protein